MALSIRFLFKGKRRSVRVYNESLQIGVLREKIGEKIEGEFELYFGGVKLDDNMTLLNYGIQHDSLIMVEKKYNLHVYPLESCYVVQVHDSIAEVKEKLERTSGLDFSNKRLMLGLGQDRVVLNDESALGQNGVREWSHVAFESDSESDESDSDSDSDSDE